MSGGERVRVALRPTLSVILAICIIGVGITQISDRVDQASRQYKNALVAADLSSDLGVLLGLGDELVKNPSAQLTAEMNDRTALVARAVSTLERSGEDSLEVSGLALQVQDYLLTLHREASFMASGEPQIAQLLALQQAAAFQALDTRATRLVVKFRGSAQRAADRARLVVIVQAVAVALGVGLLLWWAGKSRRRRGDLAALEVRAAQQSEVARLGRMALRDTDEDDLVQQILATVQSTLGADRVSMIELLPGGRFRRRTGVGWTDNKSTITVLDPRSIFAYCLARDEPLVTDDATADARFDAPSYLVDQGLHSGVAVRIRVAGADYGVLCAYTTQTGRFTADDAHFVESLANVLAGAVERFRSEDTIRHRATHDALTGLPNRTLLADRLEQALARLAFGGGQVAVMFIDVDRFKLVNDSISHAVGDVLLAQIGGRLSRKVRATDTLARFGGDEFVLLCERATDMDPAVLAERLVDAVQEPFVIDGYQLFVDLSVGVASTVDPAAEPALLLADADAAMYLAKERGGGRVERFDSGLRERAAGRLRARSELRTALDSGQFRLLYQPVVELRTGHITEVEALVRWEHPTQGLIAPAEFIPAAEDTGLIVPLGEWIIRAACTQAAHWTTRGAHGGPIKVAVNLSARQIAQPGLVEVVRGTLAETGLDPRTLTLEITETVIMDSTQATVDCIAGLRDLGVRISIDDFGTGYSSLGYLKRLPVDTLKVDRAFVTGLGSDPKDASIVQIIVGLARLLGLRSIAEGVEEEAQLAALRSLGCDAVQGYLLSRPLTVAEIEPLFGVRDLRCPPALEAG